MSQFNAISSAPHESIAPLSTRPPGRPVASITTTCNEHVTTNPQWKPGIETQALSYQFSRDKVELRPLAMKGNILLSAMSEQAMIEASSREQNVGFVLVTVEVHPE